MRRALRAVGAVVVLTAASALVACQDPGGTAKAGSCLATTASAGSLPALRLPCFDGSGPVELARLRGPAVVNLWASWCEPCRTELPAFERLARRAGDRVGVVGVATMDTRAAAGSIIDDLGLTFPMLYDDRGQLRAAIGRSALPVTLVVDADGRIAHIYQDAPLDEAGLARLLADHASVEVPP